MRLIAWMGIVLLCALLNARTSFALDQAEQSGAVATVTVHRDFVQDFDPALVSNSSAASASMDERSGGVSLPGVFLHPQNATDAILAYPKVAIPAADPQFRTFLVFRAGFRDGIPWNTDVGKPNGVRFLIGIDGTVVFSMDHAGEGWQPRAVDMTPWAGKEVTLEFRTNAIDGNTSYDWAVFGQPMLVTLREAANPSLPGDAVGVALAEITCSEPSSVIVTLGLMKQKARLEAGVTWIPLTFEQYGPVGLQVENGHAQMTRTLASLYEAQLTPPKIDLSSPLITVGHPFNVLFETKNVGLGTYTGAQTVALTTTDGQPALAFGASAAQTFQIKRLAPGESQTLTWSGLLAPQKGESTLRVGTADIRFHVFGPEPVLSSEHQNQAHIRAEPGASVAGVAENAWSRLSFVVEDGSAYALADAWNGSAWQRVGSLFPLVDVLLRGKDGEVLLKPVVKSLETAGDDLVIRFEDSATAPGNWRMTLTVNPAKSDARIYIFAELTPPADSELLSYSMPTVLAGDRAYGIQKDFAMFPGLEYLEGDEYSSSERDLAYPLSDRHAPAAYKIATPLMAVQSQSALCALLWNENQVWAPGERHPAAWFSAPKRDSGYEQIRMSLFAPSIGPYVKENEFKASKKLFPLKAGQPVRLEAWLVLDHAARYPKDSVVRGPHKGGLVLQAMQHWFEVYGLPEPSKQPRSWDAERALCRDAYEHAVWSEDPPGWAHCAGWKPGPHVGYAVPLLFDLRAGMPDPDRTEIQRRIDLVVGNALKQQGKHFLWSNAGCHILLGELPFYYGYLPDALRDFKRNGLALIDGRQNGLWVWRPHDDKTATLGKSGDHTLGQAAYPSYMALRAARFTGSPELFSKAWDALRQMEQYEVPRGAQTWECPLYQPDILAAAYAIRAYCEAYRITASEADLAQARYWAWTGLPFLYTWELDGYPTMRYNVISVIGSTFYTHSWIGLPVVWCGLVYAYALQDLAEFDHSFDWKRIAQGITNSAMWQQYADGPDKGTYPDSWNMVKNTPNPSDINPENIYMNEFRLRGQSPEIRCARFQGEDKVILLNSAADIVNPGLEHADGTVHFTLKGLQTPESVTPEQTAFSILATAPEPKTVSGAGERVADSDALQAAPSGWLYDADLQAVILKNRFTSQTRSADCVIHW